MCFLCTFSCECSLYADYLHLPVWLCKRSKDGDHYLPSYSHPCSDQLQYWINWLKRGCEALIRIKELVNDPNITGRQSCKPEAEWPKKRFCRKTQKPAKHETDDDAGDPVEPRAKHRKEQTKQTPWFWKLPGCQRQWFENLWQNFMQMFLMAFAWLPTAMKQLMMLLMRVIQDAEL